MHALHLRDHDGDVALAEFEMPFFNPLDGRRIGADVPAQAVWLTRSRTSDVFDPVASGPVLMVLLSGELRLKVDEEISLSRGDLLLVDVTRALDAYVQVDAEIWTLLVSVPGWSPRPGQMPPAPSESPRGGRPLMNWMYDDDGTSRTEPFRWPTAIWPVPSVEKWPRSEGLSLMRSVSDERHELGHAWHRVPRRQLAVTLSGHGENETGDGTITSPAAGDFVFVEDTTGTGHVSRGKGDRRILFITLADSALRLQREAD